MEKEQFWGIVAEALAAAPNDPDERGEVVTDQLCDLSVDQVIGYDRMYSEKATALFTWDTLMASYLLLGDLDPRKFELMRAWVISRGRAVHKAVRENPDSLAELVGDKNPDGRYLAEVFRGAADAAYRELEGHPIPESAFPPPAEPLGEAWDDTDEMLKARLPNLYAATRG